jgi:hypothetical protein
MNDTNKVVRIGGASGFAFDTGTAIPQMLENPPHYIVLEHMAEGSMSHFALMKERAPETGFSNTVLDIHLGQYLPDLLKAGVKVITNAGGINPHAAARYLQQRAAELSLNPKIAVVEGDDIRTLYPPLAEKGLKDMFTGESLPKQIICANAYLGAFPIAAALDKGADIVITGRVVDSALVLAPLIHEFGWRETDYDLLAAGTVIGHLLECGSQVAGGTFTDYDDIPDVCDMGFPIAECRADGSCVITKAEGTGGLLSVGTVSEQLVYEISNPAAYLVPDVTCDLTAVRIEELGPNRIQVSGMRGSAPSGLYKVLVLFHDGGWRVPALIPVLSRGAVKKARRLVDAILDRTRRLLAAHGEEAWKELKVDLIGSGESFSVGDVDPDQQTEVTVRISMITSTEKAANIFRNECVASGTNGPPGNISLGIPPIGPVHRLNAFLLPRDQVAIKITTLFDGKSWTLVETATPKASPGHSPAQVDDRAGGSASVPLIALAWGRSGDKGNLYNIGIIARRPEYLPHIRAALSEEAVTRWMSHSFDDPSRADKVRRYDVPGIHAVNFVVPDALGGGASVTLNLDCNAKTMAQRLLCFPVSVPESLAAHWDGRKLAT